MIGEWCLAQLQQQFGGDVTEDVPFSGVSTDTRTIAPGDLFVALVGPTFDGHEFIEQALAKGAVAAVVSHPVEPSIAQWVVSDTHKALADIALANRQRFHGCLYAVTGSSGKTTVKEMLYSILSQTRSVLATKGNFNNDIGVPLTLFCLNDEHQAAVIEQGASAGGEIAYTTALSLPDVAVLTNAMGAHLEGFGSLLGVVEAKAEIFSQLRKTNGYAIINADDKYAQFWLGGTEGQKRKTFSCVSDTADIYASDIKASDTGCFSFMLHRGEQVVPVQLSVMGQHNVANALAAAAAVSTQEISLQQIAEGLHRFKAVKGRMCPVKGPQGALVIDDSYNANPGSVNAAVDLLVSLPGESILVLGDMAELGADAAEQHKKVGCRAAQKGAGSLWATGALSRHSVSAFNADAQGRGRYFNTQEDLTAALNEAAVQGVNILIKGSRSAAMEQVVKSLSEGD
jgi:UDP-N-acetylmuramoyl-tripeptide--D-alanyl-D-alanine ligase